MILPPTLSDDSPKAYKALFVTLLGITLGCGDPSGATEWGGDVGAISEKVVGGWAATTDQIFATVEIRRAGASAGFCSGTLISPLVVVTAGHCAVVEPEAGVTRPASPSSLQVVAGHLASYSVAPAMVRSVFQVSVHEEYDHDFIMGRSRSGAGQGGIGSPHDIALLFLSAPFDELPNAPMLTSDRVPELLHHGDVGFVAGYGVYDLDDDLTGELYISDAVIDILGQQELLTRASRSTRRLLLRRLGGSRSTCRPRRESSSWAWCRVAVPTSSATVGTAASIHCCPHTFPGSWRPPAAGSTRSQRPASTTGRSWPKEPTP